MTTKTILSDCCQAEVKEASEPEQMLGVPAFFCGKCGKEQPTPAQDWEEEFDNKKLGCCFNYNCRFNTSDNHNQKLKSFISTQITEAEKRGMEREREKVAKLAEDLLPIQNEKKHNEAVLKLSNINN